MLSYQETLEWMYNQLPMYQLQGAVAYKADLKNTIDLLEYLGNPHHQIRCIHVAGTNGKGSVSHMLSSILQEAGYNVGLYTSPHLIDFRERIKINKEEISKEFVVEFIDKHQDFFKKKELSFFEMTVGLAFDYFASQQIDITIIEVGMGGRLDSTNVILPLISVITTIGMDHQQFLGDTLEKIATEKAGIIKEQIPVVIGEYLSETKPVFETKSKQLNAPIYWASDSISNSYNCDLKGKYQASNQKTVLQTISILQNTYNFPITETHILKGLSSVISNTGFLGRWQHIQNQPLVICDTAHNKQGLEIVVSQILEQVYERLFMVIGFVNDKDLDEVLPLLPKNATYVFTKPQIKRGLDVDILQQKASQYGLKGIGCATVLEAYNYAQSQATENDFIYIGGSTFVVGDFLSNFSCKE